MLNSPYLEEKEWIQSDSEAFQVLSEIVLDEHWLKNVEKFLSFRYCKLYNKKSKTWSLYTVKVEKDYGYMADLQSAILEARLTSDKGLPKTRKKRPNDPRQYGVLASIPPPTTQAGPVANPIPQRSRAMNAVRDHRRNWRSHTN
ncbi:unnamed protein product [Boreogadus saida]